MLFSVLTVLAAYLLGAIPFGYLVARMRGVDILAHGSGNIGATNVGRVLGRKFGVLVFALDFAKGATPVALAIWLGMDDVAQVAAGLAAFVGHLFPIYLKFRGGKGVATGAGAVFVLLPIPALAGLVVWIIVVIASRYVSLASLAAVAVLIAVHLRQSALNWADPRTAFCLLAGGLVIVRHAGNIVRLVKGTENQLKETAVMLQLRKSLHVLALGLWFGMSIFFSFVVANVLFSGFETLGKAETRESWFPQPPIYKNTTDVIDAPKEQGVRAAGHAIGPMFTWYFALQGVCGFIALATALSFLPSPGGINAGRVHRWRVNLLLVAVALVLAGWWLERQVHELRAPRNETTEAFLSNPGDARLRENMIEARATFLHWHLASVALNLATIVCVTAAMALAGNLETAPKSMPKPPEQGDEERTVEMPSDLRG